MFVFVLAILFSLREHKQGRDLTVTAKYCKCILKSELEQTIEDLNTFGLWTNAIIGNIYSYVYLGIGLNPPSLLLDNVQMKGAIFMDGFPYNTYIPLLD